MRGMKSVDLLAIVDFLYYGEANIYQENLDTFLNIAEELNLKGLDRGGGNGEDIINETKEHKHERVETSDLIPAPFRKTAKVEKNTSLNSSNFPEFISFEDQISTEKAVVIRKDEFSGELEELDNKINAMIGRGENLIPKGSAMIKVYVCKACGKEGASTTTLRAHIEANHIEGISIPCNSCQKAFRSRKALRQHRCKTLQFI